MNLNGTNTEKKRSAGAECIKTLPRPLKQEMGESLCSVANLLSIEHDYPSCYILNEALKVFDKRLLHIQRSPQLNDTDSTSCSITTLSVVITSGCDESQNKLWPNEHMDESRHTKSWEKGYPGIRTECYKDGKPTGEKGPFNPANGTTFEFLEAFFKEVTSVFPETFVHLGGNDVLTSCWKSNPDILKFMEENNFGSDFGRLESYYFDQLTEAIQSVQPDGHSITPVVWDGVYMDGYRPTKTTVIQVWNGGDWTELVEGIISAGYRVIISSCWLFTGINGPRRWMDYYACDPSAFKAEDEARNLIIGGEAIVYTEYVDESNLIMHSWPDGAAVAERLWSRDPFVTDEFQIRLNELRCYLRQ
ncbi:unnamed protein product [Trichobilharzia regenti]|nr:unnamed protein product [Trichobilharzia regenti]